MTIKDVLRKDFSNSNKLTLKRFKSSKLIFVFMSLLFFLNYFFVSNFPENSFLIKILPIIYIGFITSLLFLTYYSIKKKFKENINNILLIIIIILLIIIGVIFSLAFLVNFETLSNLI
ncbi:MAG: hypothetical protein Q9M94_00395 [Candidatus Gracilibacteria bacterium]|nr:hypothetical protein [Candidatus Gracilibacteria bacterium]